MMCTNKYRRGLNAWWRKKNLSKLTGRFENKTKQIQLWDTNIQIKVMLWVNTEYKELEINCKIDPAKLQCRQQKDKQIENVKEEWGGLM